MPRYNPNLRDPEQEREPARNQNFASERVALKRCLEAACEQAKEQRDQLLESSRQIQNALRKNQVALANFEKLMKELQENYILNAKNAEPRRAEQPKRAEQLKRAEQPKIAEPRRLAPAPWQEYEARERKISADLRQLEHENVDRKNKKLRGFK